MHRLIALGFCLLLGSPQVHACRGGMENTLFFNAIPNPQPDADLIARVFLSDVNEKSKTTTATVTVTVMQVLGASDAKFQPGDKISMKYMVDSCGPRHKSGDEGIIIAIAVTDSEGNLTLHPYMHSRSNDRPILPYKQMPRG
jgi:hypothetical protein